MIERLAADGDDIRVVLTTQARLREIAFDAVKFVVERVGQRLELPAELPGTQNSGLP